MGGAVLGAGLGLAGGLLGNRAQGKRFDTARGEIDQGVAGFANAGADLKKVALDPNRYAREKGFVNERIQGGGIGAQQRKIQQEGDLRAGQAAAGARQAAMQQMARTGQGASGAGAALASALAGGQSAMAAQSAANLERETSAEQRLENDIRRITEMSREGSRDEADLANLKANLDMNSATGIANLRSALSGMQLQKGQQEAQAFSGIGGQIAGALCFVEGTEFLMEDLTSQKIENITLGQSMAHGRVVTEIGQSFSSDIYDYEGVRVTGTHAVFEDGKYIRVENSKKATKINVKVPVRIYFLSNENHIMISNNGILFSDNMEIDADITLEASLQMLNQENSINIASSIQKQIEVRNSKPNLRRVK